MIIGGVIIGGTNPEPKIEREEQPPTAEMLSEPGWAIVRGDLGGNAAWFLGRIIFKGTTLAREDNVDGGPITLASCIEIGVNVQQGPGGVSMVQRLGNPLMLLSPAEWTIHRPLLSVMTATLPDWVRQVLAKQAARAFAMAVDLRMGESGLQRPPPAFNGPGVQ